MQRAPALLGSYEKNAFYPINLPLLNRLIEVTGWLVEPIETLTKSSTYPLIRKYSLSR